MLATKLGIFVIPMLRICACQNDAKKVDETISVARGPFPPKFLAYLVILWLEKRRPKQKYFSSPKVKYFAPPNFFGAPKFWAGHCMRQVLLTTPMGKRSNMSTAGADPRGNDWGDRSPKTYGINFIHHNFVQRGKQHSWYKAILSSTVSLQQCCEVYYISCSSELLMRLDYQILLKSIPSILLAGSAPGLPRTG